MFSNFTNTLPFFEKNLTNKKINEIGIKFE